MWTGVIHGQFLAYVLTPSAIHKIQNGKCSKLCDLNTESNASFFYYRDSLYLVNGGGIYRVLGSSVEVPFGYVPLVAKDWSDGELGAINQPHNILNNRGRLDYVISERQTGILLLDDYISSVDALYINGSLISAERYSVSSSSPYISVGGMYSGDRVSVYVTYRDAAAGLDKLKSCTRAEVFGGINTSRPFLFGGSDESLMFSASYVSESLVEEAREVFPNADLLYFPAGHEFTVGDGRHAIATVSRHYDRLLIFTEGGTWQADSSACGVEDFPVMNINSIVEVTSRRGAALLGNSPCAVGKNGIYRFTSETDELNDCNAYLISLPLGDLLTKGFLANACVFADTARGELLFSNPSASGRVFVYSERTKAWTSFEGIYADFFFDYNGEVGFAYGNELFVFDPTKNKDDYLEISAKFESNFVNASSRRTSLLSSVEMSFDGKSVVVQIGFDNDTASTITRLVSPILLHAHVTKRLCAGRFRYFRLKFTSDKTVSAIHSLAVNIR